MIISPYNPLDFGTDKFKDNSSLPSDHQQTWAKADTIWLEVIHDYPISVESPQDVIEVKIDNTSVSPHKADISIYNGKYCSVWCIALSAQNTTNTHQVTITETIGETIITTLYSNNFQVLENNHPDIANTLLLSYTNKDNRKTDRHVWINPYTSPISQYTFMWRIEGGFKDSGRQFGVDSEQFTTTTRNTLDIYALDYQVRQLTMGLGEGVPIWYAELLNRILSLSNVTIDGTQMVRNEGEVPEITPIMEGTKSFIVTQNLREVKEY